MAACCCAKLIVLNKESTNKADVIGDLITPNTSYTFINHHTKTANYVCSKSQLQFQHLPGKRFP